ncbi:MAG: hypothetical protein ABUT39_27120 [Acidobacteriota bacterium]
MKRIPLLVLCGAFLLAPRLFAGMQFDPECLQQCSDNLSSCMSNDLGCANYGDCDRCQNDYNQCVGFCPMICVEPYSESTSFSYQDWEGPSYTGGGSCHYNYLCLETVMVVKVTAVTTTTHCDSTTSTSTDVFFIDDYGANCSYVPNSCPYS